MKLFKVMPMATLFVAVLSIGGTYQARATPTEDTVNSLNANYNKVVDNCGSMNKPAFLCSGNIIRFAKYSPSYHSWDPSSNSVRMHAVSFMYLRKDISVKLEFQGQTTGIIYYPSMLKPQGKGRAEVSCAYPTDGWTGSRSDGCGRVDNNKRCQDMGIYTASAWYQNFSSAPYVDNNRQLSQCSFDMQIGRQNTAAAFNEDLKAIRMNPSPSFGYNELIIKLWPVNSENQIINPEQLPIQAFFYTNKGSYSAFMKAKNMQIDYAKATGVLVPVVNINADNPSNIRFNLPVVQ